MVSFLHVCLLIMNKRLHVRVMVAMLMMRMQNRSKLDNFVSSQRPPSAIYFQILLIMNTFC